MTTFLFTFSRPLAGLNHMGTRFTKSAIVKNMDLCMNGNILVSESKRWTGNRRKWGLEATDWLISNLASRSPDITCIFNQQNMGRYLPMPISIKRRTDSLTTHNHRVWKVTLLFPSTFLPMISLELKQACFHAPWFAVLALVRWCKKSRIAICLVCGRPRLIQQHAGTNQIAIGRNGAYRG